MPEPTFTVYGGNGSLNGADPELSRHRAYGLPNLPETPAVLAAVGRAARQRTRELGVEAMPGEATHRALAGSRKGRYHRRRLDQE